MFSTPPFLFIKNINIELTITLICVNIDIQLIYITYEKRVTMKIFQLIQDYFRQEEENNSWGKDLEELYNNELSDGIENWEIRRDESGEKIASLIK